MNYNYILTVINVFSKYAWAITIKNKSGNEESSAFQQIFKEKIPTNLHTDKATEFKNKGTKDLLNFNFILVMLDELIIGQIHLSDS